MVTVAAAAYAELARTMTADGLMFHPPLGANIWPVPSQQAPQGNLFMGALF